ncbi:hypothetical protein RSAG8_06283, partial [Rhizoctonia solani AG-8 WAC10335]
MRRHDRLHLSSRSRCVWLHGHIYSRQALHRMAPDDNIEEFIGDTIFTLREKSVAILPTIVFLGALSIALFTETKSSNSAFTVLGNNTEYLIY